MDNRFFEQPILNSPYEYPLRHWELVDGQPTQQILDKRRRAEFITPIPKPKKRRAAADQQGFVFDEGKGLSTKDQQVQAAFDALIMLEVTAKTWISAASLSSELRKKGITLPMSDIITAAVALEHNVTIMTVDQHFQQVPGLLLVK